MKTIGAMMIKLDGKVRLALIQANSNGERSVVPVGGAFAPFACASGTAINVEGRTQPAPTLCVAGTLTPGPSPTSGEGSRAGMVGVR